MASFQKVNVMTCIVTLWLSGCSLTSSLNDTTKSEQQKQLTPTTKNISLEPNPKPRPKIDPVYPPASLVIAWHASLCGGFKITEPKGRYIGEAELKALFKSLCLLGASEPEKALKQLVNSDKAFYWPDDIKQYLWLQKQTINQHIATQAQQQALAEKMQQTLSSLATIEQQLLLREDVKE
ncbi:hypothetical protein [Pseudoalteromonas mariniglutinosa]|uniref:hypothetical protein n=1 Tax=Pseudoalteromonas mariniglutinosa TaxID=206042 RepID=UPI00384A7878